MAKTSGLGSSLIAGFYDVSGDIGALSSIETTRNVQDVSGIDKSANERIVLLKDGSMSFTSFWNTVAGQAHPVLSAMPRTDVQFSWFLGSTVGNPIASILAKQATYQPTRGQDGSLVVENMAHGSGYGLEWGELLSTGKQTYASGTVNGTSIDYGSVSTLFGAAVYIHVISLGSGTPTITIKDSADNSTFLTLSPTAITLAPTVPVVSRQQTGVTATIRRYVRAEITGSYTNLVAVIGLVRYLEAP